MAWAIVSSANLTAETAVGGGFIPVRLTQGIEGAGFLPAWLTPFASLFLHANLLHIALNLMMLLICGVAVERVIGARGTIALYFAGAAAAALGQWAVDPMSEIPVIGASGAISAIVAAYALLFGRSRVRVANPSVARWLHVAWLAAAWIGIQFLLGLATRSGIGPPIATAAHVGGFLAGLVLVKPLHHLHWRKA